MLSSRLIFTKATEFNLLWTWFQPQNWKEQKKKKSQIIDFFSKRPCNNQDNVQQAGHCEKPRQGDAGLIWRMLFLT